MHYWGDDWFDKYGDDLYQAQEYIYDFTYRWSRCWLSCKEKYGTIRYEWIFPPFGGIFYRYKFQRYWYNCWLYRKWVQLGWYVCGLAIKRAIKKWPHLEEELCCDFLAPTKFGRECENKYWTKL